MRYGLRSAGLVCALVAVAGCGPVKLDSARVAPPPEAPAAKVVSFEVEQEIIPSRLPSAKRGNEVFSANCAKCHGADGVPRAAGAPNFSEPAWLRHTHPTEWIEVVSHAPQHQFAEKLTLQQMWDALAYARFLSTSVQDLRRAGNELFGKNCNVCHGNKGFGNGFLSRTMEPKPRNLSDYQAWGMLRADQEIFDNIYYGVHWSAMPPWRGVLKEDEVWQIVDFIRSLQYEVPEG